MAALESERKSFHKAKSNSAWKLQEHAGALNRNNEYITRMSSDYEKFRSRVRIDPDGYPLNPLRLDGLPVTDVKSVGTKLQKIAKNASTGGGYLSIGELYGFPVLVRTETTQKEGIEIKLNCFF